MTGDENQPQSPATNDYLYPTLCALVDRPAASAIESLARYVRPGGDYILTRSMLDEIDRAFMEVELVLRQKWNGHSWKQR